MNIFLFIRQTIGILKVLIGGHIYGQRRKKNIT
ncbi:hypothetical protein CLCHR_35910 [Clostridium chromiireducens]|uniref:Uncharacterized protein n=1 Tax=Clostridium chromiireducens TaxID=225345 RepID=A0A1V4IH04_9CLOT|nr:hypothetical protein CLCHR_35910 [Clostridium chromiireducens]